MLIKDMNKRPSKVQMANGQDSLCLFSWLRRVLFLQASHPAAQAQHPFFLPGLFSKSSLCPPSCKSCARASLTLNTDFKVRAESAVKQATCGRTGEQGFRQPHTQNGQMNGQAGKVGSR